MKKQIKKRMILITASALLGLLSTSALATYHIGVAFFSKNLSNPATGVKPTTPLNIKINSITFSPDSTFSFDPNQPTWVGQTVTAEPTSSSNTITQMIYAASAPGIYFMNLNFTLSINNESVTETKSIEVTNKSDASLASPYVIDMPNHDYSCNFSFSNPQPSATSISFFVACYPLTNATLENKL